MKDTIADSFPTNMLAERERFFADPTYNPQFSYTRTFTTHELTRWGMPKKFLYEYCLEMLAKIPAPEKVSRTEIITEEEVRTALADFNAAYKLPKPIGIVLSENLITRCKVTIENIHFQQPITYSREQFAGIIRHELETHILRRYNHAQQQWHNQQFPDEVLRRTEEGLASLHTYIYRRDKYLRKSFYSYLATYLAQQYSFSEVFSQLTGLGLAKNTAWNITTKVKRGLTDTSQPGGATKNVCYLEGILEVWHWLQDTTHDPKHLYIGRIGISQLETLLPIADTTSLKYPRFIQNTAEYYEQLTEIGTINELHNLMRE